MFLQIFTQPMYFKYWNELLFKTYYNFFLSFLIWIISLYKIDSILYFFAKDLLQKIYTPKIFFSNVLEICWIYLEISFYITIFWSLPFICLNYLLFFFNGFYKHEWVFYNKFYIFFWGGYLFNFFCIYQYIFPNFLSFFLSFENSNFYFPLYFEARFEDYFLNYLRMFFKIFFFFNSPLLLYLIFKQFNIKIFKTFLMKKIIWLYILLISLIISPPEISIQIFIFIGLILFYEIFLIFSFIFKNY